MMSLLILLLPSLLSLVSGAPRNPDSIAFDEKSCHLEADILPDKGQVQNKMAVRDNHKLWPGGNLYYRLDFDTQDEDNIYVKDLIISAVDRINAVGCVTLSPASKSASDYVSIRLGTDYSSHIGRQGGAQNLTVVRKNIHRGSIMHELLHTLGFGHEHNRPDRDDYVVIDFDNIQEQAKPYFKKYTASDLIEGEDLPYDYSSLMHATNMHDEDVNIDTSKPVIWRKDGGGALGQRTELTELDKERLRRIYSCDVCVEIDLSHDLFRYPGDCSKYIQCSNTNVFLRDCPAGLHFSTELNWCEYPPQAHCTNLSDS